MVLFLANFRIFHFTCRHMRYYLFASFLICLSIYSFSCKTVEDDFPTDLGHDYMRLEVGKFIEYEVDSIIYNPTGDSSVFSTKSYLRDVIVDTLLDNIGNVLYRTERYFKMDSLDNWQIQKVYTQSIQGNQGIKTIDNLRFIKLAFPILESNTWDPLVHIDPQTQMIVAGETLQPFKNGWRSRIHAVNEIDTVGNKEFNDVVQLREVKESNFTIEEILTIRDSIRNYTPEECDTLRINCFSPIEFRFSFEKYAKNVGLIFRERWILDSDKCQSDCNPLEIAYRECFDPCMEICLSSSTDSLTCEVNCNFVDCVNQYSNFIECTEECRVLPWVKKATKGFIMRMKIIRHN